MEFAQWVTQQLPCRARQSQEFAGAIDLALRNMQGILVVLMLDFVPDGQSNLIVHRFPL
jgi:hypothetical protein